jgi:hypothetical protein
MDITVYLQAAMRGVPLLFVVLMLVEALKRVKNKDGEQAVNDNWLLLSSLLIGLVLGIGYMVASDRPPAGDDWYPIFVYWFGLFIYGTGLGLLASLFFDALKGIVEKAVEKLIKAGMTE